MDYLRSLGHSAVSTIVQKSGLNLPFSIGAKVSTLHQACTLYDATKREDGSPVSVFEYNCGDASNRDLLPLAKNSLRKLRTTRHPDVLKFVDAVDGEGTIYIVTERVRPLASVLESWTSKTSEEREDYLIWGLHRLSVALAFINENCTSSHGCLSVDSIFISASGEWKLGGFELLSTTKDESPVLYTMAGLLSTPRSYTSPPEVQKQGWSSVKENNPSSVDAYSLGLLLHTLFNQTDVIPDTAKPPHTPPPASARGRIPTILFPLFKRLLNPNPKARLTPKGFLEVGIANDGFFASNRLVKVCLGLDNFALASEGDKAALLKSLKDSAGSFPVEFSSFKIIPSLISALEYGGAAAPAILPLVLQFGKSLPPTDYPNVILGPVVKLFASPDRGTRMALLDHLPEFAQYLDKKLVSDKIWPNLQTGFHDTVAIIREATVKSISIISPHLNDRILNNELLKHLARMQNDSEASIRTNTCILIGRLGPTLGYHTKNKVLVPAFTRALKDPFVHARVAGLMAFMATMECFEPEEIAKKVIPNMTFALVDKDKAVRDQAFQAIDLFVKRVEKYASEMPESVPEQGGGGEMPGSIQVTTAQSGVVGTAAGAAGALAGWAYTSFGKKLAAADLQSVMGSAADVSIERTASAPSAVSSSQQISHATPPTYTPTISAQRQPASVSRAKAMQLSATKVPKSPMAALAAEWEAEEADSKDSNPWVGDDLIDINADEDDWSAFESAPQAPSPIPTSPRPLAPVPVRVVPAPANLLPRSTPADRSLSPRPTPAPAQSTRAVSPRPTPPPAATSPSSSLDKAAEMARRKEERKLRIAQLKEQKKNAAVGGKS